MQMQMEPVTTPMGPYRQSPILHAPQHVVWTAPAVRVETHVQLMATVPVRLDTCIEAGVRTAAGNRRTAVQNVKTVRNRPSSKEVFTSDEDLADGLKAATDSFSNLYPCPVINGSHSNNWCCGAREGSEEQKAGCCNGALFASDLGTFAKAEAEANNTDSEASTLAASSSHTATFLSSVANTDSEASTLAASSSSHIATFLSSVATPTSTSHSEPAVTPKPTPIEPSSGPAQLSRKSVAVGTGVGVSVGALLLFGLVYLFLRERRRRVHAQKMTDDAYTTAEGTERGRDREMDRERDRERYRERGSRDTTASDYEMPGYPLPQELEYVEHGPEEICSQEVHEIHGTS